ncbi:hypothetical protein DAPPUDRAFT_107426 [Daphnia pulex]|uniref:Endonuclease/exonuclease/phosphatase domain-containing protein n=1 Tax=Daphnia pulex TaxID=6669 RepID=E9GX22_DAPPU|nr:hypothetical protein DAPPUDRAFT_107426 [Daphnia pulex]|eukprot:EFX75998.1 hypothetical protein DAPPUDRAFT_107426 [Daphnia pulex]
MCNDSASSLPKNVLPPNRIRCIQINLHHSKLASATLAQTVLNLDIDVVLIQEPYAYPAEIPVVANILPAPFNQSLMLFPRPTRFSAWTVNSNAKNRVWNSSVNDRRGEDLETLIFGSGLNIANRLCDELDFVPGGTAFVDLTLTGSRLFISRWAFLAMPSLSDHPYIYFEVDSPDFTPKPKAHPNRPIPSLSNMNLNLYRSKLLAVSTTWPRSLTCSSESEVEEHINVLVTSIHSCAQAAKTFRPVLSREKSMPWWSRELCALR